MEEILRLETISQIHKLLGDSEKHPLISFVDFSKVKHSPQSLPKISLGFYGILFKNNSKCEWKYGRNKYDFQQGTLVFFAPGQVLEVDVEERSDSKSGFGLFFHPDLLLGSALKLDQKEYSFFSYEVHEALHISEQEKQIILDLFSKIEKEIDQNIDRHTHRLIVSTIELLLNYCIRYYDRQFITRSHKSSDLITRFERLLKEYFQSDKITEEGLPSVSYCASEMNLSASYFSDLLKKETGKTCTEHIHFYLVEQAKTLLLNSDSSIKELAFQLGFSYPQHFNKIFKKYTGMSPREFRN